MRVNSYEVVVTFELDQAIVLSLGASLKKLQRHLGGQLIPINAPEDAPPHLPRIVLRLKDTFVQVGLDRLSLSIIPPSHVKSDIRKSSKFTLQRASKIVKDLAPNMPDYQWCGIITQIEFPSETKLFESGIEAVAPVFEKLINIDTGGKNLASFQFQFGVVEDPHFVNYTITGYESREFHFDGKIQKGFIPIRSEEHPLKECGIRITLDVNNKKRGSAEEPLKDIETTLRKINKLSETLPEDLNLKEVLL